MSKFLDYVVWPLVYFWVPYFVIGGAMYVTRSSSFSAKYLLKHRENQKHTNPADDDVEAIKILKNAAINMLAAFCSVTMFFSIAGYQTTVEDADYNVLVEYLGKMVASILISDCIYYHMHRVFHKIPFLYQFHKLHHIPMKSWGLVSMYCSPTEMIALNVTYVTFSPWLMNMQPTPYCVFVFILALYTLISHDGKTYAKALDATYHDKHHYKSTCNFGHIPIWDIIYGTYEH